MTKQRLQMYLLVIVVLLQQTVCSTDFESSDSELIVDFESNLDSLNLKSIFDQAESDLTKKLLNYCRQSWNL